MKTIKEVNEQSFDGVTDLNQGEKTEIVLLAEKIASEIGNKEGLKDRQFWRKNTTCKIREFQKDLLKIIKGLNSVANGLCDINVGDPVREGKSLAFEDERSIQNYLNCKIREIIYDLNWLTYRAYTRRDNGFLVELYNDDLTVKEQGENE